MIVREFNLNLEEAFLNSLINLIPKTPETKHSIAAKLRIDVSNMRVPSVRKISNVMSNLAHNLGGFIANACTLTDSCVSQDANGKRKDLIEQIYISPIVLRLKLLASTDGFNARNFSNVLGYHNVLRFIFEYAEKGTFERDVEFR